MSVFRGSIAEYPGVVVDNFTNCERGRAFFLSHCHKGEHNYQICSFNNSDPIFSLLHRSHDWIGITIHLQHPTEKVCDFVKNFASIS